MLLALRATIDGQPRAAHLSLVRSLLDEPELHAALAAIRPRGAAPLHHWSDGELAELQWPPLAAAAREDSEWAVRAHAAETAYVPWGRFAEALDSVRRHAVRDGPALRLCADAAGASAAVIISESEAAAAVGWRRNDQLLLDDGWADEALASDAVALPEEALRRAVEEAGGAEAATPAARAGQLDVLEALRKLRYLPGAGGDETLVLAGGLVSDELGRLAQALCVTEEQLGTLGVSGCAINIGEAVPLSLEHERTVGAVLSGACARTLAGFATTAERDEALLRAAEGGGARANEHERRRVQALRSRLSRKRCLAACRDACDAWVARPTAAGGTLRRPWKVHVRTSG